MTTLSLAIRTGISMEKHPFIAEKKQNTTEGEEKKTIVPSRGKLLPFAGKMGVNY